MSTALAVWSTVVEPGKKATFTAQADILLTNATLDANLADENSRTTVKLTYETPQRISVEDEEDEDEDEEKQPSLPATTSTILCSLTPGKIEQASLNIVLAEEDVVEFEVIGKNTVHLSGNYIVQPRDLPGDESEDDFDEEAYDLRDVSSDVEVDPEELDVPNDDEDRFKEINDGELHSKKRHRASDGMDVEGDDAEGPSIAGKEGQKKLNKKLKAENGEAVSSGKALVNGEVKKSKEEKKKEKKEKKEEKKEGVKQEGEKKEGGMKELPSGLQIKDVKVGTGKTAKKGDVVSMRYIGKFLSGKVFDSNTKGKPFSFKIGSGEVIKGWDEGIPGMQAGGERLLIVPPKLGYGNRKIDGIPAGSTLRFEVKLLEVK